MSAAIAKYLYIFKISFKDKIYYFNRLFAQLVLLFVRVGVLCFLYAYAFKYIGGSINGIDVQIATWSIAVYFILLSLSLRGIYTNINNDIVSGKIETYLNKPFNYLIYRFFFQLGYGFPDMFISLIACFLFLALVVGFPQLNISVMWPSKVGVIIILGCVLMGCIYSLIGILAFWMQNSRPVYWIFDKAIMVLGGAYIPVALFPSLMKEIAAYSPFGAAMFITYIFYPNFNNIFFKLIFIQLFWIITFIIILFILFKKARKRLLINGG